MSDNYTFFDVETPNNHNDRICSIAAITTDGTGTIVERKSFLVDPESPFSDDCMRIHGISPIDVRGMMTFPEIWSGGLSAMFKGIPVVAHNATYHLSVLTKTLRWYGIDEPKFDYACTQRMARSLHPEYGSYKLPDVCRSLGLSMGTHHRADDDAGACREIFLKLTAETDAVSRFFSIYEMGEGSHGGPRKQRSFSEKTEIMRLALAAFTATKEDGEVSIDEAIPTLALLTASEDVARDPLISPIVSALQESVMDGEIDASESRRLIELFEHAVNPIGEGRKQVAFPGKTFYLSGNYDHGSKAEVGKRIESLGGINAKSFTKKCDYIVIGGQGSEAYAMGNYGAKVKKAMEWQEKGAPIQIIEEDDLYR